MSDEDRKRIAELEEEVKELRDYADWLAMASLEIINSVRAMMLENNLIKFPAMAGDYKSPFNELEMTHDRLDEQIGKSFVKQGIIT